jgi:H+/Cl- antiporter ClcA/CBS domain-containing protein
MNEHELRKAATTDGLTISPSLDMVATAAQVPREDANFTWRNVWLCGVAIAIGAAAAIVSQLLIALIHLITNLSFFFRLSIAAVEPAEAVPSLGWWVVLIPVIGAIIIGVMARYGSKAIRGHGIPEAMEQVLTNESRIPARITFLKPLSAAISIGTGGPFGAEGPIIATGGALGSLIGQLSRTTPIERKTLLAAGAAAGMAATFGSPVSAVLLAVELLLFEFRSRSLVPVAFSAVAAAGVRAAIDGVDPVFAMPVPLPPSMAALVLYLLIGAVMGFAAVLVTKAVYAIEDGFEKLPIHWMWWPMIGAIAVGVVGYFAPNTLGVGYYNITDVLSDKLAPAAMAFLCAMKFVSWSIALGSGTSGGTLAPLLTIGGGIGALLGVGFSMLLPNAGMDVHVAALVGMAAMFAGASRALLASAVFAFETTLQPLGLLPLLGGCTAAYLVSSWLMRNTIMTEKISRRGIPTPGDYEPDSLDMVRVNQVMSKNVVTIRAEDHLDDVRRWLNQEAPGSTHQGYPVVDPRGMLTGVITRRELLRPTNDPRERIGALLKGIPKFVYDDCTVRQAADHMVNHSIGRLPVVHRNGPGLVIGIVTRSDVLSAFRRRLQDATVQEARLKWRPGRDKELAVAEK